ncbi:putative soyasaponin III rhamnosyltransferase [Helianthus annuus]|nr:putative soyasaponin III rhamnosyltransferase [Helianthus annuus]
MAVKKWLDGQQKVHVVYVALRSEFMVSKSELVELALGLELSGLSFFWAIRKPAGSTEFDSVELPHGFLERTRDRGIVWTSWVPQVRIEVPRNKEDGFFNKDSVARLLWSVLVDDEGKIYKANAMEWSKTFGDTKPQKRYIDDFMDCLENKRRVIT